MFYAHLGYTKTNADQQSAPTSVNKSAQLGYMCALLTANAVRSSEQIFSRRTKIQRLRDSCCNTSLRIWASEHQARPCLSPCRCRSCFKELPLTSTPGASSPLWLPAPTPVRHVFFLPFFSPCYTPPPCRGAAQTRPALLLRRCACSAREPPGRTPTYTRAHTPRFPQILLLASVAALTVKKHFQRGVFIVQTYKKNEYQKISFSAVLCGKMRCCPTPASAGLSPRRLRAHFLPDFSSSASVPVLPLFSTACA